MEEAADPLGAFRVVDQGLAKALRQRLLGEIVAGGAEPPGGDDQIGAEAGDVHRLNEPPGVVPHHGVPVYVDAQLREHLGKIPGVGVGGVAQQQLRAHGNDLGIHVVCPLLSVGE